jgi:hypothetical protein
MFKFQFKNFQSIFNQDVKAFEKFSDKKALMGKTNEIFSLIEIRNKKKGLKFN